MDYRKFVKDNKVLVNFTGILILTFIFLWIVNFFNISYPLEIAQRNVSGELAVVGVGKVDIVPDMASVDLGIVVNNASNVNEAQSQINKVNNAIVEAEKGLGVSKDDIKTSNYSIVPNYDYSKVGSGTISGYNGNTTVTIKVRQTDKLPQVIEAATNAGANQVMGTNYSVDKPEKYQEQARQKAIENAKEQAQNLAGNLGIRLGKITNIVEASTNPGPVPMLYSKEAMGMGGSNAPSADLQPGTQTITSTVTLYFGKR